MASNDQPENGGMPGRPWLQLLGMGLAILAVFVTAGIVWLRNSAQNGNAQPVQDNEPPPSLLFQNWGKPAVAIVLTGQMHGYLQPCGCSDPQYGGLARRYNFIRSLKDKGWHLVALDLGDTAAHSGPQDLLKFETTMRALDLMNYTAVGLGRNEFSLELQKVMAFKVNFKQNDPPYLISSNLKDEDDLKLVKTWVIAERGKSTVGVACLIGPSVLKQVETFPGLKFSKENAKVIPRVLKDLSAKNPDIVVLLYQGNEKEAAACAEYCAKLRTDLAQTPKVNVILCLEREEEPSGVPKMVGDTMVLGVGHKSRNLGVLGLFPTKVPGSFEPKYQLVSIGPQYETPTAKDAANPVLALMEKYAKEVKDGNYLGKFPRSKHPIQLAFPNAKYVGSERCSDCHPHAYKVWEHSKHAKAFQSLVDAKRPSLRQFDGECVVCHTVGFQHDTGYADKANNAKRNTLLEKVGCESCHGPGSVHANNPNNRALYALMNPHKAKPGEGKAAQTLRLNHLDRFCQKCHDIDNDVHWGKRLKAEWNEIAHPTPRNNEAIDGKGDDAP
jgi:hypothetical protein